MGRSIYILNYNYHQHIIEKPSGPLILLGSPLYIQNKNDNDLVLSGLNLVLVYKSFCGIVDNQKLTKYGRYVFIDIDTYQRGKTPS